MQAERELKYIYIRKNHNVLRIDSEFDYNSINSKKALPQQPCNLRIFFKILTFLKKIRSSIKPNSRFNKAHLQMIKDEASDSEQFCQTNLRKRTLNKQNLTQTLFEKIQQWEWKDQLKQLLVENQLLQRMPLIDPGQYPKLIWDFICFIIRIYLIILVPIIISFDDLSFDFNVILLILSCIVLMFDIFMRCFTITYQQGLYANDKLQILEKQMNIYTAIECISFIYTIVLAGGYSEVLSKYVLADGWPKLFLLVLYIQIGNILNLLEMGQYLLKISKTMTSLIELGKLIGLILLIQHICGCIWLIIGFNDLRNGKEGWMSQISDQDLASRYLESFYFISVNMFTVGYGDTIQIGKNEKIFIIAYMLLGILQLSYSVNTVGTILNQLKETNQFRQKLTYLNQYMHTKMISTNLQDQIREYFNDSLQQESIIQTEMIKQLPEDLQINLKKETNLTLMNKCPLLRDNFSQETKSELAQRIKLQKYYSEVTIDTKTGFNIYIIESGSVDIYQGNVKLGTIKDTYFGVSEFLSQQQSQLTYKTSQYTSLLIIPYTEFHDIIINNQEELEHFCLCQESNIYKKYCYLCTSNQHMTENCPLVHYSPNQEQVIKRFLQEKDQFRKKDFVRKLKKKFCKDYMRLQLTAQVFLKQQYKMKKNQNQSFGQVRDQEQFEELFDSLSQNEYESEDNISNNFWNQRLNFYPGGEQNIEDSLLIQSKANKKRVQFSEVDKLDKESLMQQYLPYSDEVNFQDVIFDKMKQYKTYHPECNIDHILQFYSQIPRRVGSLSKIDLIIKIYKRRSVDSIDLN